jgi:hypothetical protein
VNPRPLVHTPTSFPFFLIGIERFHESSLSSVTALLLPIRLARCATIISLVSKICGQAPAQEALQGYDIRQLAVQ